MGFPHPGVGPQVELVERLLLSARHGEGGLSGEGVAGPHHEAVKCVLGSKWGRGCRPAGSGPAVFFSIRSGHRTKDASSLDRAREIGASGIGVSGIGASGIGASGIGVSDDIGAKGIGAKGIGAKGIGPRGLGRSGSGGLLVGHARGALRSDGPRGGRVGRGIGDGGDPQRDRDALSDFCLETGVDARQEVEPDPISMKCRGTDQQKAFVNSTRFQRLEPCLKGKCRDFTLQTMQNTVPDLGGKGQFGAH